MARASSRPAGASICGQTRDGADRGDGVACQVAQVLRDRGHFVSTASVIEAERLARTLAAIRDRPTPGFEELRDAAIACLFNGEARALDDGRGRAADRRGRRMRSPPTRRSRR